MSVTGLMNQTGTIYRPTQTPDAYGDLPTTFESAGSTKLRITPPVGPDVDLGPGVQPAKEPVVFFPAASGVLDRDVVEITAGPGTGKLWRILAPVEVGAMGPAVHHVEAQLEPYTGPLALESS